MRRLRKLLKWIGVAALVLVVLAAMPVLYIETQCVRPKRTDLVAYEPIVGREHQRRFVDTFLTYPEWSIVHAYDDFAAVAKSEGETAYRYVRAVRDYWRGLCTIYGEASAHGDIAPDMRAMLHIIGLSFSAEMLVKGNWENTVGLASTVLSTESDAVEDIHARKVADDYAKFLVQTPWYEFPFGKALRELWALDFKWHNPVRSIERRIALTMEWGGKSLYARGMAALAGLAPADLKIRSVVTGLSDKDLADEPSIQLVRRLGDGSAIIETPRYRAFTSILYDLARAGGDFVEIGGHQRVLVTVLVKDGLGPLTGRSIVYRQASQGYEGSVRFVLLVDVKDVAELVRMTHPDPTAVFEHLYDF